MSLETLWELGELPFHVGPRAEPSNGSLPERLPFAVGVDTRSGCLVQMPDPAVEAALEQAYREGSQIGTPLSESGIGQRGLADFLGFLERAAGRDRFDGLSILEVGSGGGAVLRALHARGATVVGVEPGAAPDDELPFEVMREPFAPELFDDPFDLIVHHGVLEHVPDPVSFMSGQLSLLAPGGAIAFSVPDCATALAHGDISMLVHEHWSYFTERTLEAVATLGGARVVSSEPAGVAGARHSVWARRRRGARAGLAAAGPWVIRRSSRRESRAHSRPSPRPARARGPGRHLLPRPLHQLPGAARRQPAAAAVLRRRSAARRPVLSALARSDRAARRAAGRPADAPDHRLVDVRRRNSALAPFRAESGPRRHSDDRGPAAGLSPDSLQYWGQWRRE